MSGTIAKRGLARDIVVIGASAGGIEALTSLVAHLPADLPASLFGVVHISPEMPSNLAGIVGRAGPLPVSVARDKERIKQGKIFVAPPNRHLMLKGDEMRVVHGPRENRHRPAIDPLFRSAAAAFGPRVVGIVLSGALNDGTGGLLAIKRAGGITMVQDPATAAFASMPESALSYVEIDCCLPVHALASKVVSLATMDGDERKGADLTVDEMNEAQREQLRIENEIAGLNRETIFTPPPHSQVSSYTCPDCHGPLWEIQDGPLLRFRCLVGHAFTAESMFEGLADNIEESLWMALNTLQESEQLYVRLTRRAGELNQHRAAQRFTAKVEEIRTRMTAIRNLLVPANSADKQVSDTSAFAATGSRDGNDMPSRRR